MSSNHHDTAGAALGALDCLPTLGRLQGQLLHDRHNRTLRSGTTRRTQRTYQSSKTRIDDEEPPRPSCGVGLDNLRVRWKDEKLYGGRRVLGVPRTSRDGGFFLIIDDEGYLQLHGRTPFGWEPERYKEEHPDPFAEELDLRAEYFHCTRRA